MTEKMDPKRSAFLIIDYQGDILKNVESQVPTLLANAKKALAAARAAKMPIFHVKVAFRPGHPEVSPNNVGFSAAKSANRLVLGTPGAEIHPDVAAIGRDPPPYPASSPRPAAPQAPPRYSHLEADRIFLT